MPNETAASFGNDLNVAFQGTGLFLHWTDLLGGYEAGY